MIKNLATQVSSGLNLNQVGFSLIFTSPNPQVLGNSQLQRYYTKKCILNEKTGEMLISPAVNFHCKNS